MIIWLGLSLERCILQQDFHTSHILQQVYFAYLSSSNRTLAHYVPHIYFVSNYNKPHVSPYR